MKNLRLSKYLKAILVCIVAGTLLGFYLLLSNNKNLSSEEILTFEQCTEAAGSVVLQGYPETCSLKGSIYTETVLENPLGSIGKACAVTAGISGHTYTAPFDIYSFCVPNGWELYESPGGTPLNGGLITDQYGMIYKKGVKPAVSLTGGKDGEFAFSIFYNTPELPVLEKYKKVQTIQASNIAGDEYVFSQTIDSDALGEIPLGDTSYLYYFVKDGSSLEMQNFSDTSNTVQFNTVRAIAKTVSFKP